MKGTPPQVKGNLVENIANKVMKSESENHGTVEDVNVKVTEKIHLLKKDT